DTLTITAVTQGSKGSVSHNGTTVTYTPNADETGSDSFTYTISDGNGGSDTATVTMQLGSFEIFVPTMLNNFVSAPDLVVTQINASSNLIEVTVENQGTQPTTSGFWVDFYINPSPVPTHENELWDDLSAEGIAWGVNISIAAGESLTLRYSTAANAPNLYFSPNDSDYGGTLPVGTPVYAQVDSAHLNTTFGGVLETHEILGTAYNNVSAPFTAVAFLASAAEQSAASQTATAPDPFDLPLR
ncbi:MAG: cadherin-like domain-containing protein, partial [Ardenticatenaceae bacterium]|nr:cadherin-like domain-containing protein [Ardenticatenaceae bacterium]